MSIFEVPPNELIGKVAQELKKLPEIKAPEWSRFVKTGMFKERPPVERDWWQMRAAAILRSVAKLGPIGTSKLRTKYGGKKNRGVASEHFYRGSGSIARKILQQLEKAGLLKQAKKGTHKGRIITPKGQALLNRVAKEISKTLVKEKLFEEAEEKKAAEAAEPKADKPKKAEPKKEKKPAEEKATEKTDKKEQKDGKE